MRKNTLTDAMETAPAELTIIAQGARIEGASINVSGDLRIDGEVQTDELIVGQRMIVGPSGQVDSERIRAHDAVIAGNLRGRVEVEATLVLKETGRLSGVLAAARLIVEEGGICDGTFNVGTGTGSPQSGTRSFSLPDNLRSGTADAE